MTTYVLGAGASCHAGYPLAIDLGGDLVAWLARNPTPVNEKYGTDIRELQKLYRNLRDLEQILTELEDSPPGSRAAKMDAANRRRAITNMRIMIPEFFRSLRKKPADLYERLARERIQPGDVVITLNYDVALERELKRARLWEIGDGYGFPMGIDAIPQSRVTILKLHGSANWLEVAFKGMTGFFQAPPNSLGSRPIVLPGELDFLGYSIDLRDPLGPSGTAGAFPAIIMPTLNKRFYEQTSFGPELTSFWDHLWKSAERALLSSERIVVIGYSMPAGDQRARSLLLERSNRNAIVDIFCGQSTNQVSALFTSQGFGRVNAARGCHFEDYLNDTAPDESAVAVESTRRGCSR
jgi:hypothetical protein